MRWPTPRPPMRISLRALMTIVAVCALAFAALQSLWAFVFLVAGLIGLAVGCVFVALSFVTLEVCALVTHSQGRGNPRAWDEPHLCAWVWEHTAERGLRGLAGAPTWLKFA